MRSDTDWIWLLTGVAAGTILGILLYPRIVKIEEKSSDPRVFKIKSLLGEADELLKRLKNTNEYPCNL